MRRDARPIAFVIRVAADMAATVDQQNAAARKTCAEDEHAEIRSAPDYGSAEDFSGKRIKPHQRTFQANLTKPSRDILFPSAHLFHLIATNSRGTFPSEARGRQGVPIEGFRLRHRAAKGRRAGFSPGPAIPALLRDNCPQFDSTRRSGAFS